MDMTLVECRICCPLPSDDVAKENDVINEDTNSSKPEKDVLYEPGEQMRQHLIEWHSRQVALAFFYPNISNSLHVWLMSCVEFAPPPADPTTISTEDDRTEHETCNEDSTSQSSYQNEVAEGEEEVLTLDQMLTAFLNPDILSELNGKPSQTPTARKRSAANALGTSNGNAKRGMWEENPYLELNPESQSCSLDPRIFFDAADEMAAASGLVDSKAKNKVTCMVCKVDVCNTARQRHVFIVHVKKDDMYQCPKCDYMNSNSVWEAKKHCSSQHGKGTEPISNEDTHRALILKWNKRCFPDWRQKRPSWWAGGEEDGANGRLTEQPIMEVDDVTELIRARLYGSDMPVEKLVQDMVSSRSPEDSIIRDEDRSDVARTPVPEGLQVDDRTCHLCWEESRYPGRHIAQKHLKKSLYECPVCHTFGSYEGCTVTKHILKLHPEELDAQPINNLESYADEIRELQNRCFPNRPMKLVRSKESTRPRERHHCVKCGAQVAQSDRQRHVYHKHLKQTRIFECPLCNFASNYDVHRVKWHIKWMHKEEQNLEPISHENKHRNEIDALNEECFPGWQHRRKPFWWLENERAEDKKSEEDSLEGPPSKDGSPPLDAIGIKDEISDELISNGSGDVLTPMEAKREFIGQPMKRLSEWTCRLCLKEFKPTSNFLRHVAKDHLDMPLFQCPLCEEGGAADAYEVKAHLARVHEAAHLEPISNLECNPNHVQDKFQECFPNRKMKPGLFEKKKDAAPVDESKVTCQECFQEMKTEDRQIHVYRHHLKEPRLYECPLCDFAHHACSSDVRSHIKYTHRDQADVMPRANLLQHSVAITEWNERCFPGWINRKLPASVMEDFNRCRLCEEEVRQTSRHIAEAHLKIQLHVCPLCDYGAPESRLVKRHIRNQHHDDELDPVANVVARRADFSALHDKCFPGRPKRLSNITISDEGRRTKCKKCGSAVSRKRRLAHTLEKHMDRAGFGCSVCVFTHNWDEAAVTSHIKASHAKKDNAKVLCLASSFEEEVREVGVACFPDWLIEASLFE